MYKHNDTNQTMKRPTAHIMLDIETGGLKPGSAVFSIGAVVFATPGLRQINAMTRFYAGISRTSCAYYGLTEDASTMEWWEKQSQLARNEALMGTLDLTQALRNFSEFYERIARSYEVQLWGKGAGFDTNILAAAYEAVKGKAPWKYYSIQDYRTLLNLFGRNVPTERVAEIQAQRVPHTAIGDALTQADIATEIFRRLIDRGLMKEWHTQKELEDAAKGREEKVWGLPIGEDDGEE